PAEGHVNELPILLDKYYLIRNWDKKTGKPSPEKLRELGLEEIIEEIWS
ncbi:MAG: aldehyde ferredoxin oxidoreductase C-terminal domain-containing protein, partial [Dethiobacteria bacterium]